MGDRGNIAVAFRRYTERLLEAPATPQQEDEGPSAFDRVYLYTHFRGSEIREILQYALGRSAERWKHAAYLCRVIFDDLSEGAQGELTDFGISARLEDNQHPVLLVVTEVQRVFIVEEKWEREFAKLGTLPPLGGAIRFADWAKGKFPREGN